jgi:hypothetical protein
MYVYRDSNNYPGKTEDFRWKIRRGVYIHAHAIFYITLIDEDVTKNSNSFDLIFCPNDKADEKIRFYNEMLNEIYHYHVEFIIIGADNAKKVFKPGITAYERLLSLQTSILPTLSHQTWDDMISNVDDISDLTSDEKQKAKSAIVLLRDLFSQDLGSLIGERHPIVENLSMSIPWTRRWLISLAESIQILSNQTNGSKITAMLRNKDKNKYRETLLHLCIGKCLVDSNFALEFIEEKGNKAPDWIITDLRTNEHFGWSLPK